MKITKEQLKRIIKEELEAVMEVGGRSGGTGGFIKDKPTVKKPIDDYHEKILNLKKKYGKISNIPDDEMPISPGSGPTGRTAEAITEGHREKAAAMAEKIKQTEGWANIQPWHSKAELGLEDFEIDDIASSLEMMEGYEDVAQFLRDMIGSRWR